MCSFPYFRFLLHRGVGFLQPDQCFTVERTLEKEFFKFRVSPPTRDRKPKTPKKSHTKLSKSPKPRDAFLTVWETYNTSAITLPE